MKCRILHFLLAGIFLPCLCGCTVVKTSLSALKSTGHFVALETDSRVLYEPGAQDFAKQLAQSLSQAVEQVETRQYRPFAQPIEIYVCASQESYTNLTGLKAPASLTLKGLFFSPRLVEEQRPVPLYLTHELSHLHLEQQMGKYKFAKLPAWFKEGLATYVSEGGGAHTVTDQEALSAIACGSHFVPHEDGGIFFRKYASHWGLTHHMFYRQSMVFVAYLKSWNEDKYRDLLLAIQDGSSFAAAFSDAYGVRVSQIWEQFVKETKRSTAYRQAHDKRGPLASLPIANANRFFQSEMKAACSFSLLAQRKEPKERAPCPLVLRTSLRFSNGPGSQKLARCKQLTQTVREPDRLRCAMLGCGTTG